MSYPNNGILNDFKCFFFYLHTIKLFFIYKPEGETKDRISKDHKDLKGFPTSLSS